MARFVTVGRHEYTTRQRELLRKAGLTEEVARIPHVTSIDEVIKLAKANDASIVVLALPFPMMIELIQKAQRVNVDVLMFKMDDVGMERAETVEDAKRIAESRDADVWNYDPQSKTVRMKRTIALQKIKRFQVIFEADDIATL